MYRQLESVVHLTPGPCAMHCGRGFPALFITHCVEPDEGEEDYRGPSEAATDAKGEEGSVVLRLDKGEACTCPHQAVRLVAGGYQRSLINMLPSLSPAVSPQNARVSEPRRSVLSCCSFQQASPSCGAFTIYMDVRMSVLLYLQTGRRG
jgi:hypothetical protein